MMDNFRALEKSFCIESYSEDSDHKWESENFLKECSICFHLFECGSAMWRTPFFFINYDTSKEVNCHDFLESFTFKWVFKKFSFLTKIIALSLFLLL